MSQKEHNMFEEFLTYDGVIFEAVYVDANKDIMTVVYIMDHTISNMDEAFITFKLMNG